MKRLGPLLSNPFGSQRPLQATHFLGRGAEIARIRKALLAPRTRLLVHGPRRVGKTSTLHLARLGAEGRGGWAVVEGDAVPSYGAVPFPGRWRR